MHMKKIKERANSGRGRKRQKKLNVKIIIKKYSETNQNRKANDDR